MTAAQELEVFAVASADRELRVAADDRFAGWWPHLAPHVPGAAQEALAVLDTGVPVDLSLTSGVSPGDARRLINAYLHRLHLDHETLCVHAVALSRPDRGGTVVLLGGHGAGKTLVAIALAERGWRPVAGDVALLDVHPAPAVRGGTSAFVARRSAVARWFPDLRVDAPQTARIDLRGRWDGGPAPVGGRVLAAVLIDVDGDPQAHTADLTVTDGHTARTAWLRASTHLLDRVLEASGVALRLVEDAAAAHRRVALIQALASRLPLHIAWGEPLHIASRVEELGRTVSDPVTGAGAAW